MQAKIVDLYHWLAPRVCCWCDSVQQADRKLDSVAADWNVVGPSVAAASVNLRQHNFQRPFSFHRLVESQD
jgi:hypothetical protein